MTTSPLRAALRAHIGQILTPEVAAAIEAAAVPAPADPVQNPARFGLTYAAGFVMQVERLEDILEELHPLHVEHWAETERHRHGIALNPDYAFMVDCERAGRLLQFTMRTPDRVLVGNLRMYLSTSRHTQTPLATEDTLYIQPAHRGGFAVMALMRFAEQVLRSLGIREIRVNSKLVNRADVLMKRMQYQPVALEFVKFFEE